jgi:hypothetical protein
MALRSTQPLTDMSTRNISWGEKVASTYGSQPYDLHVPTVLKSGSLNLLEPSRPVQACNGIALPFSSIGMTYDAYITKPNTVDSITVDHLTQQFYMSTSSSTYKYKRTTCSSLKRPSSGPTGQE